MGTTLQGLRHGKMHSTSERPSLGQRCSGLPRMWCPPWPLRRLRVVLFSVLLSVGELRWPEQCRQFRQRCKAPVVASRFVRDVHRRTGPGTHAGPR